MSSSSDYLTGAACGLAAVSIWAGWSVATRSAVTTNLDPADIVAFRFGIAGLLLSPVVVRRGLGRGRLGWLGLGMLIAGTGAPYALLAATGLRLAPASDGGALNPGCMPLFVALIAAIFVRERLPTNRISGLALILSGAVVIVGWHSVGRSGGWNSSRLFGDVLFLVTAFLTACFTLVMKRAELDPLHAAALVSTGSLVIYLPVYLALYGAKLAQLPLADLAVQTLFQGIAVSIISLVLYGRAVIILGAAAAAAFGALVPVLSALFAIPLLGEHPSGTDWAGIVVISAGVYLASGAPLPITKRTGSDPDDHTRSDRIGRNSAVSGFGWRSLTKRLLRRWTRRNHRIRI